MSETEINDFTPATKDYVAIIAGSKCTDLPKDLYIPPDALEVILEIFEGPLDLLLYLIKKQNLDILEISVYAITNQYISYVEKIAAIKLELAADYLEMAALLTEIKSRMLLPRHHEEEEEELDPRAELIRKLQEYEKFKTAAENLDQIPREERDFFLVNLEIDTNDLNKKQPELTQVDLVETFQQILQRCALNTDHKVTQEPLSVREKMTSLISLLSDENFSEFESFFDVEEGRLGIVVTFIAILELAKESLIEIVQNEPYSTIYLRKR